MRIDVFTIFPEVIDHYADASILGRARQLGRLDLRIFPGGHFYLEDCRAGVLDVISSVLGGVRR